ncbi:MAG: ATP-binding cassette domain-containing protein [Methanomassiliicoccales archaeon]
MKELLRTEKLSKRYGNRTVVDEVDLSVKVGDVLGIIGPSGSGKSTLFRLINLLEPPTSGRILFEGQEISHFSPLSYLIRRKMAFVSQKPVAMNRSVFNNIAYGLELREVPREIIEQKVEYYLKKLYLTESRDRNARSLSGGEMQRMCFARSVIVDPTLLLLDEFTANLDPVNISILENAVRDFISEGERAAIIITHNPFQAKRLCNRTALMMEGKIVEEGETSRIFTNPIDERTRAFVSGEMIF